MSDEFDFRPFRHGAPSTRVIQPVAPPEGEVRDTSRGDRQPEGDQSVGERRDSRFRCSDAGEREHSREPGLDEAQAARRERDQSEHRRADVGEQDERRIRLGIDRLQTRDEGDVVEDPSSCRRENRGPPASTQGAPKRIAPAQQAT